MSQMLKKCILCKIEFSCDFTRKKSCDKCTPQYLKNKIKQYRNTNKEKKRARQKIYNQINQAKITAQRKTYYELNKETIAEKNRIYYEENKVILKQKRDAKKK